MDPSETRAAASPAIRPAATILLLRESSAGLEVLLTRRATQLQFLGDIWVFPGGRLEDSDCSPDAAERVLPEARTRCAPLASMAGTPLESHVVLGLHIAGCRETFEESGVLLARREDGTPCTIEVERLKARRQELAGTAGTAGAFQRMLKAEHLYADVGPLVYWAHWITPSREPRRFDTRFFAVEVPSGQEASVDRTEATEHAWVTIEAAFEQATRGTMKLAPPTLSTLQDVRETRAGYASLAEMLAGERGRTVPPIMPKFAERDGVRIVLLPWDPEYPAQAGEPCASADGYPDRLLRQPSRRTFRR